MFSQIVEPDFVGFAASPPGDNLTGRGPERFLGEQNIRGSADLVGYYGIDLRIVIIELGEFRRDIAGGLQRACPQLILDRDEGSTTVEESRREREDKEQSHAKIDRWLEWLSVPGERVQRNHSETVAIAVASSRMSSITTAAPCARSAA